MFLRKSVGIATLIIIVWNDVCSEERKIPIQVAIRGACPKGQYIKMYLFTSSFIYLCQD